MPPTAPGYAAPSPSGYTPPASGYAAPVYAPTAASPYGAPPSPYAPPPRYKAPGGYDAGTGADGGRPTKSIIGMSLSIAGLLCAITSMTLIFTWLSVRTLYSGAANVVWTFVLAGLGLALGIAGTIVSSKGRRNAAGRGMGTAGKIMGIISIVVSALVLVAAIIIVAIVVQYRW